MALSHKIPRTMHVYWEGPLPYLALLTVRSFRLWHPTWTIVLHVPSDAISHARTWETPEHSIPYVGLDYSPDLLCLVDHVVVEDSGTYPPSIRADLCRADVMAHQGGAWSDMDVLWVGSLDALPLEHADVATVFGQGLTGVLLAAPGTSYFLKFRQLGRSRVGAAQQRWDYQGAGPEALLACGATIDVVAAQHPDLAFAALARDVFYPIEYSTEFFPFTRDVHQVPDSTVGIHWHGGSPALAQFINLYATPEALRGVRTTLTVEAQRMGLL